MTSFHIFDFHYDLNFFHKQSYTFPNFEGKAFKIKLNASGVQISNLLSIIR